MGIPLAAGRFFTAADDAQAPMVVIVNQTLARRFWPGSSPIGGHVTIADHVQISGATQVSRSIAKPGFYSGSFPFDDNASWEKNALISSHCRADSPP